MPVNLAFDLIQSIRHEDTRIRVRGTHFRLGSLKGGKELGVDQSWFRVFELRGYVSCQTEVWVLVDRAWDKTGYIRDGTEYLREGVGEGRSGLYSGEVDLSNVIAGETDQQNFHQPQAPRYLHSRVVKTESRLGLRDSDLTGDLGNVLVELSPDVVIVAEDERLLRFETDGDNIFGVLLRESVGLIDFELVFEEEFLVI